MIKINSKSDALPAGVCLIPLQHNEDSRGVFTELFRNEWIAEPLPVQWNMVSSRGRVLRGVHVHLNHYDYLTVAHGAALIGLCDLRTKSSSAGQSCMLNLSADDPNLLVIPPGVAHGFYFQSDAMHIYAVSEYWNDADELGCLWSDPELGLAWPDPEPILSPRDSESLSLRELRRLLTHHGV